MTEPTLDDVRAYAAQAWRVFTRERNLNATLSWTDDAATADSRMVSARVCGQGAAYVLQLFTADFDFVLGLPGDQRPQFDYTDPGRVACVWRKCGVWIELWVSQQQALERRPVPGRLSVPRQAAAGEPALPAPIPVPAGRPARDRRGLGHRFTFTRKRRTTDKETTTS